MGGCEPPSMDIAVVPAKAGTHTPCPSFERRCPMTFAQQLRPVVMGPRVREDDAGVGHTSAFSRRDPSELCRNFPPRNKMRAWGMPGARCTRSLACKMGREHTR